MLRRRNLDLAELPSRGVFCRNRFGSRLSGTFVPGRPGAGAVLLLHQYRGSRRDMLGRARFLSHHGYAVLLFDLQAHGQSEGRYSTFGHREATDARAAVGLLRSLAPGERLAAVGRSLGGVALLLAELGTEIDALVLEAAFPSLEAAIANRARLALGPLARPVAPLLAMGLTAAGIPVRSIRPAASVPRLRCPALFVVGDADRRTTADEVEAMARRGGRHAELWVVAGVGHEDLHTAAVLAYEQRVGAFLARHLRASSGPPCTDPITTPCACADGPAVID